MFHHKYEPPVHLLYHMRLSGWFLVIHRISHFWRSRKSPPARSFGTPALQPAGGNNSELYIIFVDIILHSIFVLNNMFVFNNIRGGICARRCGASGVRVRMFALGGSHLHGRLPSTASYLIKSWACYNCRKIYTHVRAK